MVGKAQTRRIRIGNDGDAVLTIPKFSIEGSASGAFERGPGWPSEAIEILPEENFYLGTFWGEKNFRGKYAKVWAYRRPRICE